MHAPLLEQGRDALARGDWERALVLLERAVQEVPTSGEAWESLAYVYTWLQHEQRGTETRQRAYSVYRERADDLSAARVCLDLVYDFLEIRGEPAVANGWLQRARRLLDGRAPAAEHALLRIWDAYLTLEAEPAVAETHAGAAVSIAHAAGAADVGVLALAVHGLALVSQGRVPEGMSLLDEAAAGAIGREISDPQWYYFACCCMIDACDRVRDFERSLAWCDQLRDFATTWGVQAFLTTCRLKYTAALLWRGDWNEYEEQLQTAIVELRGTRPAAAAGAFARLAELRRRQGRPGEAEELLVQCGAHPLALQVRVALALDASDFESALEVLEALFRRSTASARTERVAALEMMATAHARLHQLEEAQRSASELAEIAELIDTPAVHATSRFVRGILAGAAGEHEQAKALLEDAVFLFESSGSLYEAARARVELARCLMQLGRGAAARADAAAALAVFQDHEAVTDADAARQLLRVLDTAPRDAVTPQDAPSRTLTRRQREVLSLIAEGLSDQEIATRLFLSEHTVHRHVANVFTRLEVSSRAAAVAAAIRAKLL